MYKLTQLIALLILLFSAPGFSKEYLIDGSVYIAPIPMSNGDEISLSNPSGGNREFNFSIQIDERKIVDLGFNKNFEIVGLPLDTRHLVVIRNNGNIIKSFWFSFDEYNSHELCLWFNPLYETWLLWKYDVSKHICECGSDDTTVISGNSADRHYLSKFDIETLKDKVNQGDMAAAERLAEYYEYTENDNKKAIALMRIISKSGDARVQHNLATYLIQSQSLEEQQEAVYWSELSAKQGSVLSQKRLARLYDEGEIVKQDYCKAKYWCEKVAISGEPLEMIKLSEYLEEGKCGGRNIFKAYTWLLVAERYIHPRRIHPNSSIAKKTIEKISSFEKQLSESEKNQAKDVSNELLDEFRGDF